MTDPRLYSPSHLDYPCPTRTRDVRLWPDVLAWPVGSASATEDELLAHAYDCAVNRGRGLYARARLDVVEIGVTSSWWVPVDVAHAAFERVIESLGCHV